MDIIYILKRSNIPETVQNRGYKTITFGLRKIYGPISDLKLHYRRVWRNGGDMCSDKELIHIPTVKSIFPSAVWQFGKVL